MDNTWLELGNQLAKVIAEAFDKKLTERINGLKVFPWWDEDDECDLEPVYEEEGTSKAASGPPPPLNHKVVLFNGSLDGEYGFFIFFPQTPAPSVFRKP